jgi:hypothetical protein
MLSVLLNWMYIFCITQLIGFGFFRCINHFAKTQVPINIFHNAVCGMVITTVYAQFFSLFYKVGLVANIILVVICIAIVVMNRRDIHLPRKNTVISWDTLVYIGVILLFAFATSRGQIHTDTSLYHAQAIRWYEEYGAVKGLANLQWHFGYNSSYFGFAALFSLSFLGFGSFHCTTGFIAAIVCLWAVSYLKDFSSRKRHVTDFCALGILFYALVNFVGFVSPASDYATMFFATYLVARWAEESESEENNITSFSLLSVLAVFTVSLKLSAALLVLLAIYPAVYLIKEKRGKEIALYIVLGLVTILPFLIRNVIISGWLLYPFPAIDLFNVDWKLPKQYAIIDSAYIKTWARCLYDVSLIDMPIREWLPIWWSEQENYGQYLIICNLLAIVLDIATLLHCIFRKKKIRLNIVLLILVNVICAIAWLLLAPFIRYGLAFLLVTPLIAVGIWMYPKKSSFYRIVSGLIVILMFFFASPYWEHYFVDDMVFIKQNLTEPYYIMQRDYETSEMTEYDMNGVTVYSPIEGQITGYQSFPASSYGYMITNTELRGKSLKDGFRNTEYK